MHGCSLLVPVTQQKVFETEFPTIHQPLSKTSKQAAHSSVSGFFNKEQTKMKLSFSVTLMICQTAEPEWNSIQQDLRCTEPTFLVSHC